MNFDSFEVGKSSQSDCTGFSERSLRKWKRGTINGRIVTDLR